MIWNQVKVPRHNLNTFCLEIVCKYMYFFKVKILFSTDGSTVQLQTRHVQIYQMKSHTKIKNYFILWSDTEIGKILWIKTWILQKKTVWPKSIKTKLWQLESLVNRYVFSFVMFMISTYILWFYECMINCCCFFLFWKIQDYSAMMSGNQKGIPLKVPSIPIKVLSPNTTQVCLL